MDSLGNKEGDISHSIYTFDTAGNKLTAFTWLWFYGKPQNYELDSMFYSNNIYTGYLKYKWNGSTQMWYLNAECIYTRDTAMSSDSITYLDSPIFNSSQWGMLRIVTTKRTTKGQFSQIALRNGSSGTMNILNLQNRFYDSSNKLTLILFQSYIFQNLTPSGRTDYIYDSLQRIVKIIHKGNYPFFEYPQKDSFGYNNLSEITSKISSTESDTAITKKYITDDSTSYSYDSTRNLISTSIYKYTNGTYIISSKATDSFDSSNRIILSKYFSYDSKGHYTNNGSSYTLYADTFTNGIESNTFSEKLFLFPNPGTDMINIHFTNSMHRGTLQIIDNTGRIVFQVENMEGTDFTVQRNNLPLGTYILVLSDASHKYYGKIIWE